MHGDQPAAGFAAPRGRLSRRRLVGGAALGTLGALQLGLGGQPARSIKRLQQTKIFWTTLGQRLDISPRRKVII